MKVFHAELTIPVEQYGNIKPVVDGTADEIVEAYFEFSRLLKPKEGIPVKDFNEALDRYLNEGKGTLEVYQAMSPAQQAVFQEIKKAFKRIEAKNK